MALARPGADYIQYITAKEHAQKNDEDNSEGRVVRVGMGGRGRNVEEMYKGF